MKQENGFAYKILILIITAILIVGGVVLYKILGKNGVREHVEEVEMQYAKENILEKINYLVTQKFIEINNQAKANGQNISEIYNSDVVIEYLKQSEIIEDLTDEAGNVKENVYKINPEKLQENEKNNYQGKYQLEKKDEIFMVTYIDSKGNSEDVGELQINK